MQYQETLRILVGSSEVEYVVPQTLLVENSDFFRSASHQGWKEAEERLVLCQKWRRRCSTTTFIGCTAV